MRGRGVATSRQKTQVRTYLGQKYGKILSQFGCFLDVMFKESVRRTNNNLFTSNFDIICDDVGISPPHRHSLMVNHQLNTL